MNTLQAAVYRILNAIGKPKVAKMLMFLHMEVLGYVVKVKTGGRKWPVENTS